MSSSSVLILGATSDVGMAIAKQYIQLGVKVFLATRDSDRLRTAMVDWPDSSLAQVISFEATDYVNHTSWIQSLPELPPITVLVFGYLGDHARAIREWGEAERIINSNYTGAVSILNIISNEYEKRGAGTIVGISSVAGDRGRQSNYLYGSAKAGFTAYLSGLRNRLFPKGVHVVTVKPGFINSKMTTGLNLPKQLTASPDQVATRIINAVIRKRNVIYVLSIWYWIMLIIRNIPEFIFKRIKL